MKISVTITREQVLNIYETILKTALLFQSVKYSRRQAFFENSQFSSVATEKYRDNNFAHFLVGDSFKPDRNVTFHGVIIFSSVAMRSFPSPLAEK